MKITVVTISFNCVSDIENTIQSVLNQTHNELEYIVVDGGSTDGTIDVIAKYKNRITKFLSEPDNGVYDAMNKGIALATGEWINFMNAGDSFADNSAIKDFFDLVCLDDDKNDILYGDVIIKYSHGRYYKDCHPDGVKEYWCHQSMFCRASILKQWKFDTSFRLRADANFIHLAQMNGSKMLYYPRVISVYDAGGISSFDTVGLQLENARIYNTQKNLDWYRDLLIKYYYQKKTKLYEIINGSSLKIILKFFCRETVQGSNEITDSRMKKIE